MKTISRTRKCAGHLALAIVLLIAADRHYPAAMCALGIDASGQKAGVDIVAAARSQIGVPLVIHNVGKGAKEEPYLFAYPVVGHFRCR